MVDSTVYNTLENFCSPIYQVIKGVVDPVLFLPTAVRNLNNREKSSIDSVVSADGHEQRLTPEEAKWFQRPGKVYTGALIGSWSVTFASLFAGGCVTVLSPYHPDEKYLLALIPLGITNIGSGIYEAYRKTKRDEILKKNGNATLPIRPTPEIQSEGRHRRTNWHEDCADLGGFDD